MAVKTQKQLDQEAAQKAQEQEAQAAEEMAAKARADETTTETTGESEASSEEPSVWGDLLEEEENSANEQSDFEEEPDTSGEEAAESTETEEGVADESETTPGEGEEAAETPSEPETVGEGEGEDDVEIPTQKPEQETRSPEEVKEEISKAREQAHEKLMETFKLTDEQAEALQDNPNEVLPKMAADLYLNLFDDVAKMMQAQVPTLMQQTQQYQRQKEANERKFFKAWPKLANEEYLPTINRIADNYRAMHPDADPDRAVKEIGAQAWVALQLPLDELVKLTGDTGDTQAQETGNVREFPSTRKPGGAGNPADQNLQHAPKQRNEFEQIADEIINEDEM